MGAKILRHQDLLVYKKAIKAAMEIFEVSKSFPKKRLTHLLIRYVDHRGLFLQILPKHGGNDVIRQHL